MSVAANPLLGTLLHAFGAIRNRALNIHDKELGNEQIRIGHRGERRQD